MKKELVLKNARRDAGFSQKELSIAAKLGQSHISKMERGDAWATNETCERLAKILGIPVSDLIDVDIYMPSAGDLRLDKQIDIAKNSKLPKGLRELAEDKKLCRTLDVTSKEWLCLSTIQLPSSIKKDGYMALLMFIRGIT